MSIQVDVLTPEEWATVSEVAYKKSFGEDRPASLDRIDFALVFHSGDQRPVGFATGSAINADVFHLKMGGAFPKDTGIAPMKHLYPATHLYLRARGFKQVLTLINSGNVKMLRHAMAQGYRISGFSNFGGDPLVELFLDLGGNHGT